MNYFPADSGAKTAIGVFRSTPKVGLERGKVFDVRLMERHPFSSQVFAPMGKGVVSDSAFTFPSTAACFGE